MIDLPEQEPISTLPPSRPSIPTRLWLLVKRPFSEPRLPWILIALLLLITATDITFSLIDQPPDYWRENTFDYTGIQSLVSLGPVLSILLSLIYLIALLLILRIFTLSIAFILWMIFNFYHFRGAIGALECGLPGLFQLTNSGACYTFNLVLSATLTALLGLLLLCVLFPSGKLITSEPPLPRKATALSIVWSLLLLVGLVGAIRLPDTGWIPIFPENKPPPRIDGMIAYDSNRQVAVLFGGRTQVEGQEIQQYDNDTWEWNGVDWIQRFSENNPTDRRVHAMAYDKVRGVVVLFGGESSGGALNDTWEWDGQQWRFYSPPIRPPARCCHRLFFDDQRGKVVLYGGFMGSGPATTFYNDGWEWDGENWTQIVFDSFTPAASNFDIVHDTARGRTVAFLTGTGTWIWVGGQWSKLPLAEEVPLRQSFRMAYTPLEAQTVLFGGLEEDIFMNDTWLFDGQSWRELKVSKPPAGRWGHAMFFDEMRQRIIFFGGWDGFRYRNDMWELAIPD